MQNKGFTLIEILTVVVIIAMAVVISVPTYKQSKAASMYQKAQGQLAQIGTAVQAFQRDLYPRYFPAHDVPETMAMTANHRRIDNGWKDDPVIDKGAGASLQTVCDFHDGDTATDCLREVLFERGYLQPLVFNGPNGTLDNYSFFVCDPYDYSSTVATGAWNNRHGCNRRKGPDSTTLGVAQPVASMELTNNAGSWDNTAKKSFTNAKRLPYFRAVFLSDGTIERQTYEQARAKETMTEPVPL